MANGNRPLAIVTGASSGIGFELAKLCAESGFDLIIAADMPEIEQAAEALRSTGVNVESLLVDLATREGVEALHAQVGGRSVDYLLANAGHGLGRAFLDQDFDEIEHVIDTNITGTVYLIQLVTREMRARGEGRVLITGSIAGFMPGAFSAVYNGTKAFINSFSFALRNELKDSGVTITCLMPGATDTDFFERADEVDTKVGAEEKDLAYDVAKDGFDAMMAGKGDVVSGVYNKMMTAMASVTPSGMVAEQHRWLAEPGTDKNAKK
jgi:short-subunit dehydrogenase